MSGLRSYFEKRSDEAMAGLIDHSYPMFGGSSTGIHVTPKTAERATVVFACIRILSETPASLPLNLYRMTKEGKEIAFDHPLYKILHFRANPEVSSFDWRVSVFGDMARGGNSYSYIDSDRNGNIVGLYRLDPDSVSIWRDTKTFKLWYVVKMPERIGGEYRKIPAESIFHTRMFSKDGLTGRSPIRMHAESIGLSLATEKYGATYFGNGSAPGVVLLTPKTLSDTAYNHLRESWNEMHQGLENAHKAAILEEDTKIDKTAIPNDEAQFLETRKFQIGEIASRIYRIPPHMVGDLDRATFSNIEHQSIEFVEFSLMPWLTNFEMAIYNQLLTTAEQNIYSAKFLVDGLLRGDIKSRYEAYGVGKQNGFLSTNDIRAKEDMNTVKNGDVLMSPLNMVPLDQISSTVREINKLLEVRKYLTEDDLRKAADRSPVTEQDLSEWRNGIMVRNATLRSVKCRHRMIGAYRTMYEDAAKRLVKRETQDVIALAKRDFKTRGFSAFADDLRNFYSGDFIEAAKRIMLPVAMAYGDQVADEAVDEVNGTKDQNRVDRFIRSYVEDYANRHSIMNLQEITDLMKQCEANGDDAVSSLEKTFEKWNENLPESIANEESVRMNNAAALHVYKTGGVQNVRWFTYGGSSCSYCNGLDGKMVNINDPFVRSGEVYQPEGADKPFTSETDIRHSPLHKGCECMIGAA